MKIGIVTPCFNSVATIEETILSVLSQDGMELEYVIMDGGSTDGTVDIIKRYADRLAWWVSETDGGQVAALNRAFPKMTADVLGFLNADDVLLPGALNMVAQALAEHPEADIVHGGIEWIDFEGRPLGSHLGRIESLEDILDLTRVWWAERQWVQPEVFFRRQWKERIGGFSERYDLTFDYEFWVRCFHEGVGVVRIETPVAKYRKHPGQKSTDARRANAQLREIALRHLKGAPGIGWWRSFELRASLTYDLYQNETEIPSRSPAFPRALISHPEWLLCKNVRARLSSYLERILARMPQNNSSK